MYSVYTATEQSRFLRSFWFTHLQQQYLEVLFVHVGVKTRNNILSTFRVMDPLTRREKISTTNKSRGCTVLRTSKILSDDSDNMLRDYTLLVLP